MHLSAGPVKALAPILVRFVHFFALTWKGNLPISLCFKTKDENGGEKYGGESFLEEGRLMVH